MKDDLNPEFIFASTDTALLVNTLKEGNVEKLLKRELKKRGLDANGNWIGFKAAEDYWPDAI